MLAGEAVVAIWNGIAPGAEDEFQRWHTLEHIPERVGIPGFRRGRRYAALGAATHPAFFTLYEVDTMQVLQGQDYANRLNAPTPWTRSTTAQFRDTARALARVIASHGPGMGGALLTIRLDIADPAPLLDRLTRMAALTRICGVHLCEADRESSEVRTAESKDRTDIQAPPAWFVMVEAAGAEALDGVLPDADLAQAGAGRVTRGLYGLEYVRGKTAWT